MEGGKLNKRITVQRYTGECDAYGDPSYGVAASWTDVCAVWADIEPLSSREWMALQQMQGEVTAKVRIRYRSGITSDMRIKHGCRIYQIIGPGVDMGGRGQWLQLYVREVEA